MNREQAEKIYSEIREALGVHDQGKPVLPWTVYDGIRAAIKPILDALTEREEKPSVGVTCERCNVNGVYECETDAHEDGWKDVSQIGIRAWHCSSCARDLAKFPKVVKSGPVTPLVIDGKTVGVEQVQEVSWTDVNRAWPKKPESVSEAEREYHLALDVVANRPSYWAHEDALKAAVKVIEGLRDRLSQATEQRDYWKRVTESEAAKDSLARAESAEAKLAEAISLRPADHDCAEVMERMERAEKKLKIVSLGLESIKYMMGDTEHLRRVAVETLKKIDGEGEEKGLNEEPVEVVPVGHSTPPSPSPLSTLRELKAAREKVDDDCRGLIFCVGGIPKDIRDGPLWRNFVASYKAERSITDNVIKTLHDD